MEIATLNKQKTVVREFEKWRAIRASVSGVLAWVTCQRVWRGWHACVGDVLVWVGWVGACVDDVLAWVTCQRGYRGWGGWRAGVGDMLLLFYCYY